MERLVKSLGGHSGCKILLMQKDDLFFVRKISSGIEYNDRLLIQIQKQKSFSNERIRAPKVYDEGTFEDGLVYFDMEYIQGITLAKGIATQNISQMGDLVERIVGIFDIGSVADVAKGQNDIFKKKILSLEESLKEVDRKNVSEAISFLKNVTWNKIEMSKCHGDLTFENIILRNGHLYVIDFLDSFYDSWMLDASTLLQDAMMLWSYKDQKEIDTNLLIKLMVFRDLLENRLEEVSPDYVNQVRVLLLLKLIRIFPYAKEEYVKDYLDRSAGKLIAQL